MLLVEKKVRFSPSQYEAVPLEECLAMFKAGSARSYHSIRADPLIFSMYDLYQVVCELCILPE